VIFRLNQSSGIPLYLQLVEQVKHAVETGAYQAGDKLPTIRRVAEDLIMNPNTVARAYRELEHDGIIELRHGSGAFIKDPGEGRAEVLGKAQAVVRSAIERLGALKLTDDELRRLFENELLQSRSASHSEKVGGGKS
jgi:GntR family transcriptional regulator